MMNTSILIQGAGLYVYALLAANTLVLYGGLLAILRLKALCDRQETLLERPQSRPPVTSGVRSAEIERTYSQSLLRIEKQLLDLRNDVAAQADSPLATPPGDRCLPLDNAVRMAKNGATADELARSCGLNAGEAQLVRTIHGMQCADAGSGE